MFCVSLLVVCVTYVFSYVMCVLSDVLWYLCTCGCACVHLHDMFMVCAK